MVTYEALSQAQGSSADSSTTATIAAPAGAHACLISVETTNARMLFESGTPGTTNGHVMVKDQPPIFMPFGEDILFRSTAGTASVVNVTWLG